MFKKEVFGQTALTFSLENNQSMESMGQEHSFPQLKNWACAASPFHDVSGNIHGIIAFFSKVEDYPDYALGMVSALAQAVEKEGTWKEITKNLEISKRFLDIISEGTRDGVLCS